MKNTIKLLLVTLLTLALILCSFASCDRGDSPDTEESSEIKVEGIWESAKYTKSTEFGEGEKTVKVKVVAEEQAIIFTIHTNEKILGDALASHGLVEGEEGQYGLYIKKVNGMLADYDIDGTYWGFYKNGEYMMTGVDTTEFADGESFELVRAR